MSQENAEAFKREALEAAALPGVGNSRANRNAG
jgi:hypothetical protein